MKELDEEKRLVEEAISGNPAALESVLESVRDGVFNLSLRMLGMLPDAEDATQEILIKVMTHLSSFRQESRLTTWVYRIAVNHLQNYRKGMFAQHPLSFETYGEDIASGREKDVPDLSGGVDQSLLEEELKLSCTNVMLQCLDADSRCIYILGTMFRLDSRMAADILGITPEAYRQRLSRVRKKMANFLSAYCGLSDTGVCSCKHRTNYAIATHRIDPNHMNFTTLSPCTYADLLDCRDAMEELDNQSQIFAGLPAYRSTEHLTSWIRRVMDSESFFAIVNGKESSK